MTHQERIEQMYEELRNYAVAALRSAPRASEPGVVLIVSMHDAESGQWILADGQDAGVVAQRLRLCADILEAQG